MASYTSNKLCADFNGRQFGYHQRTLNAVTCLRVEYHFVHKYRSSDCSCIWLPAFQCYLHPIFIVDEMSVSLQTS